MSSQVREILVYNNEEYRMAEEPLRKYLAKLDNEMNLDYVFSNCWRGYAGKWEISHNKLYLTELASMTDGGYIFDMKVLFPGKKKVFAEWYSGEIRIPRGEMTNYIHMGYASVFEEDLFLELENGILINSWVIKNTEKTVRSKGELNTDKEQQN